MRDPDAARHIEVTASRPVNWSAHMSNLETLDRIWSRRVRSCTTLSESEKSDVLEVCRRYTLGAGGEMHLTPGAVAADTGCRVEHVQRVLSKATFAGLIQTFPDRDERSVTLRYV